MSPYQPPSLSLFCRVIEWGVFRVCPALVMLNKRLLFDLRCQGEDKSLVTIMNLPGVAEFRALSKCPQFNVLNLMIFCLEIFELSRKEIFKKT